MSSENQTLASTIAELNARWNTAFNSKQAGQVASFYDPAATVMPAGAPAVSGPDAILQFWENLIGLGFSDHGIELLETGVDGGLAYQRGKWSAVGTDAEGKRQTYGGNLQLLYRRQNDGSWKILSHIWN